MLTSYWSVPLGAVLSVGSETTKLLPPPSTALLLSPVAIPAGSGFGGTVWAVHEVTNSARMPAAASAVPTERFSDFTIHSLLELTLLAYRPGQVVCDGAGGAGKVAPLVQDQLIPAARATQRTI